MQPKRYHIIIDVKHVAKKYLEDAESLEAFLKELPGKIGMKILNGPNVVKGVPENPGITGFVIIDFSHISIHTFTDYKEAMVDIFSCKAYEQKTAVDAVLDHFHADSSHITLKEVMWG